MRLPPLAWPLPLVPFDPFAGLPFAAGGAESDEVAFFVLPPPYVERKKSLNMKIICATIFAMGGWVSAWRSAGGCFGV